MMLAIRYVMVSTVLLGFWCSSYALPAAHAQDPVQEAQQAVNDAQAKAKAAQKAAGEAHAKVDEAQAKVDAATQERDLAKLIADKKQATFQNATGGTEALAEGAFVSAAAALNEKQRNLKGEIRAQKKISRPGIRLLPRRRQLWLQRKRKPPMKLHQLSRGAGT
jgi:hypothetical protein